MLEELSNVDVSLRVAAGTVEVGTAETVCNWTIGVSIGLTSASEVDDG